MKLVMQRVWSDDQGSMSLLMGDKGVICSMSELPWRNNKRGLSRIPVGTYKVTYMKRSASGKYRDVYHIHNVVGRSGVLIHGGNYTGDRLKGWKTHSLGCVLPCKRFGYLGKQRAGLVSKGALRLIHAYTGRKDFILEVR